MGEVTELHQAIMSRDACSFAEADKLIQSMKVRVEKGEDPSDVLEEEGFEPDYVFDIL
jgi:hypothetical protein